jgi:hypothetical protein
MKKIEWAQLFLSMGIAVIPLRHRGKEPASHMMGGSWEKYKTSLPIEYDVRNWLWSDWQNYGVVAGHGDLAVIDFDTMDAFGLWSDYYSILSKHGVIETVPFMVKTARGVHVYVRLHGDYNNRKLRGVDVKIHGYVVGPESTHPSGAIYTPLNSNMAFPDVYSLEMLLPSDLFPKIAPEASTGQIEASLDWSAMPKLPNRDCDPFEAAAMVGQTDLITLVKSSYRIEDMFPSRIQTSGDGRWWAVVCPFHDDHHPSFWIDTRRQLCGCATCGMLPMDVINLYARMHGVSDAVAVGEMAKMVVMV